MKKILATLLFAALLAFPAAAQGTGDAVVMTSQGDRATVAVTLPQNEASGVTSLSLSFDVQKGTEGSVRFDFSDTLPSSVQQYRYNAETGRLTVYLSGTKPIFTDGRATLGTIRLDSAQSAAASVRVGEDALKLVNAAFGAVTAVEIAEQSIDLTVTADSAKPEVPQTPESPEQPEEPGNPVTPDSPESSESAGSAGTGQTTSGQSPSSGSAASSAGASGLSSSRPADSDAESEPDVSSQTSSASSAPASSASQAESETSGGAQPSSDEDAFPVWITVFLTAAGAAVLILAAILIRRMRR